MATSSSQTVYAFQQYGDHDIEPVEKVASGGFGTVMLYRLKHGDRRLVAVKLGQARNLTRELNFLRRLAGKHQNIVQVMGCVPDGGFVMEYHAEGTLADILDPPVFENARLIFPVYNHRHIIHWCTQLASVLSFLQDQQIVHGDLKPQNILMKYKRLSIRVCDFGSARDCASSREVSNWAQSQEQASTRRSYTPRYHAPQRGIGSGGFKDDIYSFGIILWQLLTRKEPYDKIPGDEVLARVAEGLRPPIDPAMPAVFEQILLRCWDQNIEACFEAPQLSYAMRQLADRFRDPLELLGTFGYRTRPDLDPESWAGTELKPLEGSTFSDLSTKQSGQSGSVEVELTGKMFDAVEGYWDYCQDYVNTNPPKKSSGRILKNVATYCFDTIHELSHLPDDPDLTTSVINQFPPLLRDFVAHMKD